MLFFLVPQKNYYLITYIQYKFWFIDHSINNIRMHIEVTQQILIECLL